MVLKKEVKRCNHTECKKKLSLLDFDCQCGHKYCSKHRLPEDHNCNFSHKQKEKEQLKEKLYQDKTTSTKVHNKL